MKYMDSVIKATRRHGFNPIVGDIQKKQEQWYNWFRGDVNGFHLFKRRVSGKMVEFERETMNMPKKICEDFASLIWNDMCDVKFKTKEAKEAYQNVVEANEFETNFGQLLELSMGVGMGYMVQYLNDNETKIDYIPYRNALPLEFDNTKVKALLTLSFHKIEGEDKPVYVKHLTYHMVNKETGGYEVKHEAYLSDSEDSLGKRSIKCLRHIFDDKTLKEMERVVFDKKGNVVDIEFVVEYDTDKPFFQVIGPNIKNHFDFNSPYLISVYSTMIGYFKTADTLFDMLKSEAEDNQTKVIVDSQLLQTQLEENESTGEASYVTYFDESQSTFMGLPLKRDENKEQKAIEFLQGDLRMDQLEIGIDKSLQLIGFRAGLGRGYYRFKDGQTYQNVENVLHSNSDTHKTKKKHEIIIGQAIKDMALSILHLEKLAGRYNLDPDDEEIEVVFDDSLIIDDEAEEKKYMELVDKGYIPIWKAVAKILKLSEPEAKELVAQAKSEDDVSAMLGITSADRGEDDDEDVDDKIVEGVIVG